MKTPKEIYEENKQKHKLIIKQKHELDEIMYCGNTYRDNFDSGSCYRIIEEDNNNMITSKYGYCMFHNEKLDDTKNNVSKTYLCKCGKSRFLSNESITCQKCYSNIPKKIKVTSDFFKNITVYYCDLEKECTGHFEFSLRSECCYNHYGMETYTKCKGILKMKEEDIDEQDIIDEDSCFYVYNFIKSSTQRKIFGDEEKDEKDEKKENNQIIKLLNELETQKKSEIYNTLKRENLECPICYKSIIDSITITSCSHAFHSECLLSWNESHKKNCPMCRNKDMSYDFVYNSNSNDCNENPKAIYKENFKNIKLLKKEDDYLDSIKYCGSKYYAFFNGTFDDYTEDDACYRIIDYNDKKRITIETEFCKIHDNCPIKIVKNYVCECGKKDSLSDDTIQCKGCLDLIPEYIEKCTENFNSVQIHYCSSNIIENTMDFYSSFRNYYRNNYRRDDNCPGHFEFRGICYCDDRCCVSPIYVSECEKDNWYGDDELEVQIEF